MKSGSSKTESTRHAPLFAVSGADVYVIQSLHSGPVESAHDKFCRLLFFVGALKDGGAARVTVVVPYLCYAKGSTDKAQRSRDDAVHRDHLRGGWRRRNRHA